MDRPRRGELARFAAPAALVLAVTVGALLVRAGFESGNASQPATTAVATTTRAHTTTSARTSSTASTATTTTAKQYYTIQSGDTLETVAAKVGKTVDELLALNPGVDPHTLRIGQKIRVG